MIKAIFIDIDGNKNQIGYDLYKEIISNYRKQVNSLDTQKIEDYFGGLVKIAL